MATVKSYTDIEQSKKLAEILPLESANYTRLGKNEDNVLARPYFESCSSELNEWVGQKIYFLVGVLQHCLKLCHNLLLNI